jgi:hypothetical protein
MNIRMTELMQDRRKLLARITAQRDEIAEIGTLWRIPLVVADQGVDAMRFLRRHPLLVAGVVSLFVIRRRGLAGLVIGAWRVWKKYRSFNVL